MRCADGMCVYRESPDELSAAEIASTASGLHCKDPSLAIQSQLEESDINTIVSRFGIGELQARANGFTWPEFHFDGIFDYQECANQLIAADRSFMSLPATIRKEFDNSPAAFVEFCESEEKDPRIMALFQKFKLAPEVSNVEPKRVDVAAPQKVAADDGVPEASGAGAAGSGASGSVGSGKRSSTR